MQMDKTEDLSLRGINFTKDTVEDAMRANRLLLLDLDMTGQCNLLCVYCDRTPDRFEKGNENLSFEEKKRVISDAITLGCKTVEIPGAGEPMLDVHFWPLLEFISAEGLIPVVYTSGWHMTESYASRLYELGASVLIKYNSSDNKVQDILAGTKGFGLRSERALQILMRAGFNRAWPTRMGIDMIVLPQYLNISDIENIFRWCRKNNIFFYGKSVIPQGKSEDRQHVLGKDDSSNILRTIERIDRTEFGNAYKAVLPVFGSFVCRQVNVGLFVNLNGKIYDCNGLGRFLGDYRNGLISVWNSDIARQIRAKHQNGYCYPRERYWNRVEAEYTTSGNQGLSNSTIV